MGIKSKVLGIFAAMALTVSFSAGIVSAQTDGRAVLAPAQCEAGPAANVGNPDFGTWVYDGSSGYVLQGTLGDHNTHTFYVNVAKVPEPGATCPVVVDITKPLTNDNDDVIPTSSFSVYRSPDDSEAMIPHTYQQGLGTIAYTVALNTVPGNISTGTYEGVVSLTVFIAP